jgi:hypothetical protein
MAGAKSFDDAAKATTVKGQVPNQVQNLVTHHFIVEPGRLRRQNPVIRAFVDELPVGPQTEVVKGGFQRLGGPGH